MEDLWTGLRNGFLARWVLQDFSFHWMIVNKCRGKSGPVSTNSFLRLLYLLGNEHPMPHLCNFLMNFLMSHNICQMCGGNDQHMPSVLCVRWRFGYVLQLFNFDVHEDVRVINDASVEKDESHAGKVVERHWYDKNKHIFPASRWEVSMMIVLVQKACASCM